MPPFILPLCSKSRMTDSFGNFKGRYWACAELQQTSHNSILLLMIQPYKHCRHCILWRGKQSRGNFCSLNPGLLWSILTSLNLHQQFGGASLRRVSKRKGNSLRSSALWCCWDPPLPLSVNLPPTPSNTLSFLISFHCHSLLTYLYSWS